MSKTDTAKQLLVVALQDLRDAERAWGERGATVCAAAGTDVSAFLAMDMERSAAQARALESALSDLDAPLDGDPNIWLRAVIDDAERDARSIVAGPLRDSALIGALRKGKQAERVSYETAIQLAQRLGKDVMAAALTRIRDEEAQADDSLAALLSATIGQIRQ